MTRQHLAFAPLLLTVFLCAPDAVHGQLAAERIQRPINTPTFSPYLNMFRQGDNSGAALNYFGLVRPQLQAYEANQQLGQNIQQLQLRQQQGQRGGGMRYPSYSRLGITGHPAVFQSFTAGSQSGGGGAAVGGLSSSIGGGGFGAGAFGGGASAGFSQGGVGGSAGFGTGGLPGTGFQSGGFGAGSLTGHAASFGTGVGQVGGGLGGR